MDCNSSNLSPLINLAKFKVLNLNSITAGGGCVFPTPPVQNISNELKSPHQVSGQTDEQCTKLQPYDELSHTVCSIKLSKVFS